jgi:hypothetical protein
MKNGGRRHASAPRASPNQRENSLKVRASKYSTASALPDASATVNVPLFVPLSARGNRAGSYEGEHCPARRVPHTGGLLTAPGAGRIAPTAKNNGAGRVDGASARRWPWAVGAAGCPVPHHPASVLHGSAGGAFPSAMSSQQLERSQQGLAFRPRVSVSEPLGARWAHCASSHSQVQAPIHRLQVLSTASLLKFDVVINQYSLLLPSSLYDPGAHARSV